MTTRMRTKLHILSAVSQAATTRRGDSFTTEPLCYPAVACAILQVPEGSGEQGKMEKTGCKIICGAPTTLAVKGLMMMMMSFTTKTSTNTTLFY